MSILQVLYTELQIRYTYICLLIVLYARLLSETLLETSETGTLGIKHTGTMFKVVFLNMSLELTFAILYVWHNVSDFNHVAKKYVVLILLLEFTPIFDMTKKLFMVLVFFY